MANMNIFDMTDTWNLGGTTYNAIKMNVTDAASASDSLLIDLQVGGASKFKVAKTGDVTMTSSDAGASAGPVLTQRRDSASPAASDIIGKWLLQGEDSAGNTEDYAEAYVSIVDATSTSEDASWLFRAKVAGVMTTLLTLAPTLATFSGAMTVSGAFTSLGIDDNATGERLQLADTLLTYGAAGADFSFVGAADDRGFGLSGGNAAGSGSNIALYGGTHATTANDILLRSGADNVLFWDDSAATLFLYADAGTLKAQLTSSAFSPTTTDGLSLGTSALNWADLFLDLGAVINFDSGDVTLTHSANALTLAGGSLTVEALTTTGAFTSLGIDDNATVENFQLANDLATWGRSGNTFAHTHVDDTVSFVVSGGSSFNSGSNITLRGGTHATLANDIEFKSGSNLVYFFDDSADTHYWYALAGTQRLQLTSSALSPTSNDGAALGISGTAWADLFLASGAVINFAASDVTITHSADALSFAGAASGYTFNNPVSIATTSTSPLTITVSDDGATGGIFVRALVSASPAASDIIARDIINGKDSGGTTTAYWDARYSIVDPTDGSEDGRLTWLTMVAGATSTVFTVGPGVVVGNPTGGDKGIGTLNAVGVYDDNTLLTCYPFDAFLDGDIDEEKWDALVPDRHYPAVYDDKAVVTPARDEARIHEPMRKFKARLGTETDPLDLDAYSRHWQEKRHLTSLPNERKYDPQKGLSTGEWLQRLIETVEIQAIHLHNLNQRIKALEAL